VGALEKQKQKNQSESIGGVLAKNPSMVKSVIEESPRTQEHKS